jgi:uncharacterized protein
MASPRTATTFFVVVLAVAFGAGLPAAAATHGWLPASTPATGLFALVLFSPALVAVALSWRTGGGTAVRTLLGAIGRWRLSVRWHLVALGLPFAVNAAALTLHAAAGGSLPALPGEPAPEQQLLPLWALPLAFLLFSLGEEIGWRGYALPRLQRRTGAAVASLIIGAAWIAWHLPLKLAADTTQGAIPIGSYILATLAVSIIFTWLYNSTDGSLLPVVLLHAAVQAANVALPVLPTATQTAILYQISAALYVMVAMIVVVGCGPRDLARGGRVTSCSPGAAEQAGNPAGAPASLRGPASDRTAAATEEEVLFMVSATRRPRDESEGHMRRR